MSTVVRLRGGGKGGTGRGGVKEKEREGGGGREEERKSEDNHDDAVSNDSEKRYTHGMELSSRIFGRHTTREAARVPVPVPVRACCACPCLLCACTRKLVRAYDLLLLGCVLHVRVWCECLCSGGGAGEGGMYVWIVLEKIRREMFGRLHIIYVH